VSKPKAPRIPDPPGLSVEPAIAPLTQSRPLVFISHDSRDAALAEQFSNLLTDVSAGTLKSFRSSDKKGTSGIEFGAEWYKAIMDQLGNATDVVALLTQHSIDRPWILYEAGVAKGKLDAKVFGVALGVPLEKATTGPFAQFQNCADDEDSLTKLVMQLLQRNPDAAPREEAVRMQVKAFGQKLPTLTKTHAPKAPATEKVDETAIAKLFEEVKVYFRELPEQVESKLAKANGGPSGRWRRKRRFHPGMMEEFLFLPKMLDGGPDGGNGEAVTWLMLASMFRDDAPWFYEIGVEVFKALRSGDPKQVASARHLLRGTINAIRHGHPLLEEVVGRDEETYMMVRHLDRVLDHLLERMESRRKDRKADGPPELPAKAAPSEEK
jgi:hypothetical protein